MAHHKTPEVATQSAPAPKKWTRQDRLQFAVRFATEDLSQYSDGDWLKLREDFDRYLLLRMNATVVLEDLGGFVPTVIADDPVDMPRSWFVELQQEVGVLLRRIAGHLPRITPGQPPPNDWLRPISIAVEKYPVQKMEAGWLMSVRGRSRDVFFEVLFGLLAQEPADQIRLCPRPECGRMFYRIRRQEYCSRRCVNKAYQDSPKGVAIRKARYEKQGWKFGARKAPAKVRRAVSTRKG